MKRIVQLNIRITLVLDDKINDYCDQLNLTRSSLIHKALLFYLSEKGYKDIERLNQMELARSQTREDNFALYLNTNALVTIVKMAKTSLLLTGRIDQDKLKIPIKNYKKLYNLLPVRIKKVLKGEMATIEKLQYSSNIKEYINNWDMIQEFMGLKKGTKRIDHR